MNVIKVGLDSPAPEAIRTAAEAIRRGELVVFPTETVYGLAADALNEFAVRRVFEVKGRYHALPLPLQVAGLDELSKVAASIPEVGRALAERFWPGPLTLILPKRPDISPLISAGQETVGVRVPDHPVALALIRDLGSPIVATSANISGEEPPTDASQAIRRLGFAVAVVLDAGTTQLGVESTVVDVSVDPARILRRGAIGLAQIVEIIGEVRDGA